MSDAASGGAPRDERRRLSALLIEPRVGQGGAAEPEALLVDLRHLLGRVEVAAERYEGRLDRVLNPAVLVVFGAEEAHEDAPERAVRAALDLLGEAGLNGARAAVCTGLALVGELGRGGARAAFGGPVREASALLSRVEPGALWVDAATAGGLRGRAGLEPVEPGVSRVRGWQPQAEPERLGPGPLIGREVERTAIMEALARLVEGRGGVLAITGPAGAGKSRLVRESLQLAGPWTVHVGRCISYGRTMPLHLWSEITASLLALPGAPEALEALDRADRSGGRRREAAAWLAAGLREQLGGEAGARPRSRANEGISDLLVHAAKSQAAVLVLEDLHWADSASMDLLSALIARVRVLPVLVIACWRAEAGDADEQRLALAARRASLPYRRLALDPLTPAQTRQLIDALLGRAHDLSEPMIDRLVQLSGGVPLFVGELLGQLREQGALTREGSGWSLHEDADMLSPAGFAVLAVRLDRLEPELRQVLEVAAVVGVEFDPAVVEATLGEVPSSWVRLEALGLILGGEDRATGAARLRFRQALLREVALARLSPARRQQIHAAVVERDRGALRTVERAWHLERAGRGREAAMAWAEAARQARSLDIIQESIDLFERASRADPTEELVVGPELAGMLLRVGRLGDAVALTDRLLPRLEGSDLHGVRARLLNERAYLAYRVGDGPGIVRFAEAAQAAAERSGDPLALADALRNVGIGHEFTGRFPLARAAWQRVVELAQGPNEVPLRRIVVNVYNSLGEICRMEGRYTEALSWYDKSRDAKQRLNPGPYNLVWLINTSAALVGLRRHEEALSRSSEAIRLTEAGGARGVLPEVLVNHALALHGVGRTPEALVAARRARDEAANQNQGEILGIALRIFGLLQLSQGEDAIASLSESVARLSGAGKPVDEARSRRALAEALERKGERGRSIREREKAARLLRGAGLEEQAEAIFQRPKRLLELAMAPSVDGETGRRMVTADELF